MTTLQRCLGMLERYRIPHLHTSHPNAYRAREVAESERLPARMFAKTVILHSVNGFAMAVLPADCTVLLEELETALDLEQLRLATEEDIAHRFPDSEVGTVPPFGSLFGVPLYMDVRLTEGTYIAFSAGTHRDAIHMKVADYRRLVNPCIIRFGRPGHVRSFEAAAMPR
jgi:Ala-tRNA(Pro) deacylase